MKITDIVTLLADLAVQLEYHYFVLYSLGTILGGNVNSLIIETVAWALHFEYIMIQTEKEWGSHSRVVAC